MYSCSAPRDVTSSPTAQMQHPTARSPLARPLQCTHHQWHSHRVLQCQGSNHRYLMSNTPTLLHTSTHPSPQASLAPTNGVPYTAPPGQPPRPMGTPMGAPIMAPPAARPPPGLASTPGPATSFAAPPPLRGPPIGACMAILCCSVRPHIPPMHAQARLSVGKRGPPGPRGRPWDPPWAPPPQEDYQVHHRDRPPRGWRQQRSIPRPWEEFLNTSLPHRCQEQHRPWPLPVCRWQHHPWARLEADP